MISMARWGRGLIPEMGKVGTGLIPATTFLLISKYYCQPKTSIDPIKLKIPFPFLLQILVLRTFCTQDGGHSPKFCGSGMFYPGSLNFSSRIRIPGVKKHRIPVLLSIKGGMKNKTNLFLAPYGFRNKFY
jgi:hypothetical protein